MSGKLQAAADVDAGRAMLEELGRIGRKHQPGSATDSSTSAWTMRSFGRVLVATLAR